MKSGLPYNFNRQDFLNKIHPALKPIPFKYAPELFSDYDIFNFVSARTRITIINPFQSFIYGVEFYTLWSTQGSIACKVMLFISPDSWTSKVLKESGWFNIATLQDDFGNKPNNMTNYEYMLDQSESWIVMASQDLWYRIHAKTSTIPPFDQIAAYWIVNFDKNREKQDNRRV